MENNDKELKSQSGNKLKVGIAVALIVLGIIGVAVLCLKFAGKGFSNTRPTTCPATDTVRSIAVSYLEEGEIAETVTTDIPNLEIQAEDPVKTKKGDITEKKGHINPLNDAVCVYVDSSKENDSYTITYCQDGKSLWATDISGYWVKDINFAKDCVYAIGETYPARAGDEYVYFTKLDLGGKVIFTQKIDHDLESEGMVKVIDNGDGTCTAFSYEIAGKIICAATYDSNGNMVSDHKIKTDQFMTLHDVIRVGDGYLLRVGEIALDRGEVFYRLDKEYNISDGLIYGNDGNLLHIRDTIEYEGRLYISAYAVGVKASTGKQYEIDNLVSHVAQNPGSGALDDSSLAERLREEYTAILLVCDEQTGEPTKCFTVPGSMGTDLSVNKDNMLAWGAETVVYAQFAAPTVSSHIIEGTCRIYRYFFDTSDTFRGFEQGGISLYMR